MPPESLPASGLVTGRSKGLGKGKSRGPARLPKCVAPGTRNSLVGEAVCSTSATVARGTTTQETANPMPNTSPRRTFDAVVVGPGTSGECACKRLAEAGLTVALIDAEPPQSGKNFTERVAPFQLK